jgi:hypothetical protein
MDNRPDNPAAKAFQSAGVGGGIEVVVVPDVVVVAGTVVVVTVVVELDVVVDGSVLVDVVVPPALWRLAPQAAPRAAKPPTVPIRRSWRRLSTSPALPITPRLCVGRGRSPRSAGDEGLCGSETSVEVPDRTILDQGPAATQDAAVRDNGWAHNQHTGGPGPDPPAFIKTLPCQGQE